MKYFIQTSVWKNLKKWPKSCHKRQISKFNDQKYKTNKSVYE